MDSIQIFLTKFNTKLGKDGKVAFLSTFLIGLFTHFLALSSDIPNHDGLASMYFDQNMITSGRWFLGIACGISSYYLLPWLIGILALVYISATTVVLVKLLRIENFILITLIGGLLITFPALTSNFAYLFTMDGYMIGLFLAVLCVYLVDNHKLGFLFGGISLAFSMGIYQAYLPIAMLLALYKAALVIAGDEDVKAKIKSVLRYLYMGLIGVSLYYVILKVMLLITGKELDTYQGIDNLANKPWQDPIGTLKAMYGDFITFTLKGNVLFSNGFALTAILLLLVAFGASLIYMAIKKKWVKSVAFYVIILLIALIAPLFTNVILIISPNVTYHLLMRYQWVMFGIIAIAFISEVLKEYATLNTLAWITVVAGFVLIFTNAVSDNVAYSNLQKKYEKTYAYCLRLADRIEQTEGYYEGIPIYMIGVVGTDNYPVTDITENVTDHMIGISGDYLLYTSENYEQFYKYYMGITFNFLSPDEANYYDTKEYIEMPSFPGTGSTKVVDGVLYVKTENMH